MSGEHGKGVVAETGAQTPPKVIWSNFGRMPTEHKLWAAVDHRSDTAAAERSSAREFRGAL
jgi:hypothetical protein